jgi:hypothetical protein
MGRGVRLEGMDSDEKTFQYKAPTDSFLTWKVDHKKRHAARDKFVYSCCLTVAIIAFGLLIFLSPLIWAMIAFWLDPRFVD